MLATVPLPADCDGENALPDSSLYTSRNGPCLGSAISHKVTHELQRDKQVTMFTKRINYSSKGYLCIIGKWWGRGEYREMRGHQ